MTNPHNVAFYDMAPRTLNHIPYVMPPGIEPKPHEAQIKGIVFTAKVRDQILVEKTRFLWLCGIVRYNDPFTFDPVTKQGDEGETRFCFIYDTRFDSPEPFWREGGSVLLNGAK